jgi:CRP-like cAMP-binding protein
MNFFGYAPLLEETVYHDNAEVLEDVTVMLIPKSDFFTTCFRAICKQQSDL